MTYVNFCFVTGTMIIGDYRGQVVSVARAAIKKDLLKAERAFTYSEPDTLVISRSGDECVVALTDQWYENYGEAEWKSEVEQYVRSSNFETYDSQTKQKLLTAIDWLKGWCW